MSDDNITESWICVNCGVNTAPGLPDGPTLRKNPALLAKNEVLTDFDKNNSEIYMVRKAVWEKAGMEPFGGCQPKDFEHDHIFNRFL
jgi:hypothetical protein